jgi:hypothetical protein
MFCVASHLFTVYMSSLGSDSIFVFHMRCAISIVVRHCGAFPEPQLPRGDSTYKTRQISN